MNNGSSTVDIFLRHGTIVTMDPERRILVDGSIAIANGKITSVGPDKDIAPSLKSSVVRDLHGAVVHPGLVDAHVHTGLDLIRGLVSESTADWTDVETPFINSRTAKDDYLSTLICCMEMVSNGSTIYSDTGSSYDLDATAEATKLVGARGMPGAFLADQAGEIDGWLAPLDECLNTLEAQSKRYPFQNGGKVRCAISLSGMETASDQLLIESKMLANKLDVPMIMHQSWDEEEVQETLQTHGKRPIEHLADLGILGPNLTLVHMIHLDENEVDLIAETNTKVVHCPSASIRRAKGAFRVGKIVEMLEHGVPESLGSDGHSGKHDITRQMYLAATVHRETRNQIPIISAQTAFEMATINGAKALSMESEIGSLTPGKAADLVIHGLNRIESRPRFRNPLVNIVYHSLSSTVSSVMVDGEFIFDDGRFMRFDEEEIFKELDLRSQAIEEKCGIQLDNDWPLVN